MQRFRNQAERSAAVCGTSILLILAAVATALAQAPAPANCELPPMQSATGGAAVTSPPQRGWQMEGRDIEVTLTSSNLPANAKPIVCFRLKFLSGKREYVQAETVRLIARSSSDQQPATLKLAVTVPYLMQGNIRPETVAHTPDNAAPISDVRVLLLAADGKPVDEAMMTIAIATANDYCNIPNLGARTDSGTVTPSASKNWQPAGGEIEFAAKASKTIPSDALIRVCLRWKLAEGDPGKFSESGPIRVLDRQPSAVKLAVSVPEIEKKPPRVWELRTNDPRVGSYAILGLLVPEVDVRALVFDADLNPVVDAWTKIGVTSVWFAIIAVVLTVAIAFLGLWVVSRRRFPTLKKTNPLLFLITTRSGFASLSQFQIILWTFVVVASAVYVIALSGDLIPITTGTLVLLGISGTATVISKAKSESDATSAPPPLDPAKAAAEAQVAKDDAQRARTAALAAAPDAKAEADSAAEEAEAKAEAARTKAEAAEASAAAVRKRAAIATAADTAKAEADARAAEDVAEAKRKDAAIAAAKAAAITRIRHPRWSDLVMEEIEGRELDVTRVQMLYFTLVTAVFVAMKVITSYEIPIIPEGFLILMGISNSVYVGSKFATNPAAKS